MGGHGPIFQQVVDRIRDEGLDQRIITPGFVDPVEILSIADVLVLPSVLDGRPNIVLEAMAMGVPVVASNVGGLPSLIHHGETGFLHSPADLQGFATSIELLMDQQELRSRMGANAANYAREFLSDKIMHQKYDALLNEITNSRRA